MLFHGGKVEFVSSKDEFKSSFLIIVLATYEVANRPFAFKTALSVCLFSS